MAIGPTGPRYSRIHSDAVLAGFPTNAALSTNLTGTNNDLVYTAKDRGVGGNGTTVEYVDPAAPDEELSVEVTDEAIVVNLETDGTNAITSTADDVAAAVAGDVEANALVSVADKAGNDGSGVVTALAETSLAGGTDYVVGASR